MFPLFLAYFFPRMIEVSQIKLENSIFSLKSVLKLYFKHFYLKLLNSCLYKNSLSRQTEVYVCYGVVRFSLVVFLSNSLKQRVRSNLETHGVNRRHFYSELCNYTTCSCNTI